MAIESDDARKRVVDYLDKRGTNPKYADLIHWFHPSITADAAELTMSDLRDVLTDADRDHRFAEAVREACDAGQRESDISTRLVVVHNGIHDAHKRIYSTPCTASASNAGAKEEDK